MTDDQLKELIERDKDAQREEGCGACACPMKQNGCGGCGQAGGGPDSTEDA